MEFTDLLVPVDFSPASLYAARQAAELAPQGGSVNLLHVVDAEFVLQVEALGLGGGRQALFQRLRTDAEARLDEVAEHLRREGIEVTTMAVVGRPFVEILRIASELDYDLIVIGNRVGGHDIEQALFGSTAERVLRAGVKPVLTLPVAEGEEIGS